MFVFQLINVLNLLTMAKPIKETPVLRGKDAEKFLREMQKNEQQKISLMELKQISKSYERIASCETV
jgi:hypothetical protein